MTPLTVLSTKQGIAYDEATAVTAFSKVESLLRFAARLRSWLATAATRPGRRQASHPARAVRA